MKKVAIIHNFLGGFSNFVFLFFTSIILLPYYFKFISTSDYGIWLGGISFLSLVSVLEANISLILTQQLGNKWINRNIDEFSKYYFAALAIGIIACITIFLLTFLIKDPLTIWVSPKGQYNSLFANSFLLYATALGISILAGFISTIAQVFLKTLLPPFLGIASAIIGIAYTVIAVSSEGIMAIATGNLIRSALYLILISLYARKLLKRNIIPVLIKSDYILRLIKDIGLPFVSKVAITLAVNLQNFIIAATISSTTTTIYDITRKVPSIVQMVMNMVAVSTFTSFSLFYSEQKNSLLHPYTKYYFTGIRVILLIALFFVFLLGKDFIKVWVGLDKFGGNTLLGLLCFTILLDQLRMTLSQQYYAIGNFRFTSVSDSVFAISFMAFAFLLIPFLKLYGIVLAGIIANVIYFIFCSVLEKRRQTEMIKNVINKQFFVALIGIGTLALTSKYFYELFSSNIAAETLIVFISFTVLTGFILIIQKDTIDFFIKIILKGKKTA